MTEPIRATIIPLVDMPNEMRNYLIEQIFDAIEQICKINGQEIASIQVK